MAFAFFTKKYYYRHFQIYTRTIWTENLQSPQATPTCWRKTNKLSYWWRKNRMNVKDIYHLSTTYLWGRKFAIANHGFLFNPVTSICIWKGQPVKGHILRHFYFENCAKICSHKLSNKRFSKDLQEHCSEFPAAYILHWEIKQQPPTFSVARKE